jgi:hypothetical protein
MSSFLNTVWGEAEGFRCVVSGKMRHAFFAGNSATIPKGKDVWFAPAIFSIEERKIPNVVSVKAFWLDIDCGKPKTYTDKIEAVTALRDFIDQLGLPEPAVVNSGNGIHVWWVLDKHITPAQWHPIANALREACVEHTLLADHGITIDIARIMRVPGTQNHKDPNNLKPVELLTGVEIHTLEQMEEALGAFKFKAELKTNAKNSNSIFAVDLPQTPKDAEAIADKCGQLDNFRRSRGNLPEPEWYAGLGVLALCVDGRTIAQEWSSGHPSYSADATDAKFERAVEFAPTTCAKYAEVNPEGCQGCPFAGKVTTPVQLGETVTPIAAVQPVAVPDQPRPVLSSDPGRELVKRDENQDIILPRGYLCGEEGVFLSVVGDGEDGEVERKIISTQPLWVSGFASSNSDGESEVEITWIDANGNHKTRACPYAITAVDAQLEGWLKGRGIHGIGNVKLVKQYICASVSAYTKQRGEAVVFDNFGLHERGFVIGRELITATKREAAQISSHIAKARVDGLCPKGTLETWAEASALLDRPQWWMHRFAVLGALASPIFAFTGQQGSVLSLAGESSGGKTTAANFGVSAYGNPDVLTLKPASTINSFYENWRQVGSLPVVVNEAATMANKTATKLSELVYAAANGEARESNTRSNRIISKGNWRTLSIFTSNTHLLALPQTIIADAERKRILELTFNTENKMDIATGKRLSEVARNHHGVVGRILIEYMVRYPNDLIALVAEKQKEYEAGIDPSYRFGIWQISVNAAVGEIALKLGLIRFKIEDAIANAIDSLRKRSEDTIDPVAMVRQTLDDYTNKFQESIGQREATNSKGWYKEPRGEARGKWKMNAGKSVELCIGISLFTAYALEHGLDANYVRQWAKLEGITSKTERLAESANPVRCYIIPADKVNHDAD